MSGLPDVLVAIDSNQEDIAIEEARCLGIPVVAIVDTNSCPDKVDYMIPGNDDAIRSIRLYLGAMADAILDAKPIETEKADKAQKALTATVKRKVTKTVTKKAEDSAAEAPAVEAEVAEVVEAKPAKKTVAKKPTVKKTEDKAVAAEKKPAVKKPAAKKATEAKNRREESAC